MKHLYVHKFQIVYDVHESLNWNTIHPPEFDGMDILLLTSLSRTDWHLNKDF
jgi:hypothetical protein